MLAVIQELWSSLLLYLPKDTPRRLRIHCGMSFSALCQVSTKNVSVYTAIACVIKFGTSTETTMSEKHCANATCSIEAIGSNFEVNFLKLTPS